MKMFQCDHCGKTENPKEDADYVEDWEHVTISTHFHYDICQQCAPALFGFFTVVIFTEPSSSDTSKTDRGTA